MTQRIVLVEFIIQEVDRSVTDAGAVGRFISLPARFNEKGSWRVVKQTTPLIEEQEYSKDITLRDYFAAKAMQALVSKHGNGEGRICMEAYKIADAMIDERNEQ